MTLERHEYARRDRDLLWYLFRGAVWQQFSKWVFLATTILISQPHNRFTDIFILRNVAYSCDVGQE